ncbi:hypothetical protein CBS101457_003201 [Exobasidium rhododendri]|nr:hypothetical protein CBS101457_003201 [Exobasidium rhododendri]
MPSLPPALKSLLKQPTFAPRPSLHQTGVILPAGRAAGPMTAPSQSTLYQTFDRLSDDAKGKGVGWGEWLSLATATLVTLNSPGSLQALHKHSAPTSLAIDQRVERACLMREVGLKCIGFVGIPKVINQLAALRSAVDEDEELVSALPKEPRRKITAKELEPVQKAAYDLWDDIYTPLSDKLIHILGKSHPDLPVFIVDSEYGPLFAPPNTFTAISSPSWEVNRLRTSLVALSGLRSQGGVGPQVTSHVWGLLKSKKSIAVNDENKKGLEWLTTEDGALWAIRTIDSLCLAIEGAEQEEAVKVQRESKL